MNRSENLSPLLSICVPTFNRAELLEICLASVLPQVAQMSDRVECIVSDNCSNDNSAEVLESYRTQFPFLRVHRNIQNEGIIANITRCCCELARGTYVLLIGDDDVLCAGTVSRILAAAASDPAPQLIALNVAFLPESERATVEEAKAGVTPRSCSTLRPRNLAGRIDFADLFTGPPCDFTASYSVVIPRESWLSEFPETCFEPPFSSLRTTYPSAAVIARNLPHTTEVIAEPGVVVFELPPSKYSWANVRTQCTTYYLTLLLKRFEAQGIPANRLAPYFNFQLQNRIEELADLMWRNPFSAKGRYFGKFLWLFRSQPFSLAMTMLRCGGQPSAPWPVRIPIQVARLFAKHLRFQK